MPHGNIGWAVHQGWGDNWAKPPDSLLWLRLLANQSLATGATTTMGSLGNWVEVYTSGGWDVVGVSGYIKPPEGITHLQMRSSAWCSHPGSATGNFWMWHEVVAGTPDSFGPNTGTTILPHWSDESLTRNTAAFVPHVDTGIIEAPQGGAPNLIGIFWRNETGQTATVSTGWYSWCFCAGWSLV